MRIHWRCPMLSFIMSTDNYSKGILMFGTRRAAIVLISFSMIAVGIAAPSNAVTVFSDDFSGSYPGAWFIGHDGGGGSYAWAWPNGYAHEYSNPSGGQFYYPNNLHVYMERRNVSLAGYASATLSFYYIVDTEATWDVFTVNVRDQSGAWHEHFRRSGPTDPLNWTLKQIDLSQYAGQTGLYIQFRFDSDPSVSGSPYDGVFIDSVVLDATSTTSFGGTVTDCNTGSPIAGATVQWCTYSTTTNASGIYSFSNLPCQTCNLIISKPCYQTFSQSYTPICNASNQKNACLVSLCSGVGVIIDSSTGCPSSANPSTGVSGTVTGRWWNSCAFPNSLLRLVVGFRNPGSGAWVGPEPVDLGISGNPSECAPGSSFGTPSWTINTPSSTGTYHLWLYVAEASTPSLAIADFKAHTQVSEVDREKRLCSNVQVGLSDLVPQAFQCLDGTTLQRGQLVDVSYTICNNCSGPANHQINWCDRVILSQNSILGDSDDLPQFCGADGLSSALLPGQCYTKTYYDLVSIPNNWPIGTSYLIFNADAFNNVPECNEANNVTSLQITIQGPDIRIEPTTLSLTSCDGNTSLSNEFTNEHDTDNPDDSAILCEIMDDPQLGDAVRTQLMVTSTTVARLTLPEQPGSPFAVTVPLGGRLHTLKLRPFSTRAENFQVLAPNTVGALIPVEPEPPKTYRGVVADIPESYVAASLLDTGLQALVMLPGHQRYVIEPVVGQVGANRSIHAVYRSSDALPQEGHCGTDGEKSVKKSDSNEIRTGSPCGGSLCIAELACDADFEYFQDYGSITAVQDRIELIINSMNVQYENEVQIRHQITTIIVRTAEPDPYVATNSWLLLNEFRNEWLANQTGVVRDVAKLFTGKAIDSPVIGQAYTIGAMCNDQAYCHSQNDYYASFSCATDLAAHELGHLWDATHCNPCVETTMHTPLQCANTFAAVSVSQIVTYRDSVTCLSPPGGTSSFAVYNDGNAPLNISSVNLQNASCWLSVSPATFPLSISEGQSQVFSVQLDSGCVPPGSYSDRLLVNSNDPDENPYPGGVYVNLTLDAPPNISQHPSSATICQGQSNQFCVSATGTSPLSYQWQRNGNDILGETFSCHTANQPGTYSCVVTNGCESVPSDPATLIVHAAGGGDTNGDGALDGLDIRALANFILHGGSPSPDYCAGDMNGDGSVNIGDVPGFVGVLTTP